MSQAVDPHELLGRPVTRRSVLGGIGLLGAGLTAAEFLDACSRLNSAPAITTDKATWGFPAAIDGLDNRTISPVTESVVSCGLEGLIRIDINGQVIPSLAESWS